MSSWQAGDALLQGLGFRPGECSIDKGFRSESWLWPTEGQNKCLYVRYENGCHWLIFQAEYPGPHRDAVRHRGFADEQDFKQTLAGIGFPV